MPGTADLEYLTLGLGVMTFICGSGVSVDALKYLCRQTVQQVWQLLNNHIKPLFFMHISFISKRACSRQGSQSKINCFQITITMGTILLLPIYLNLVWQCRFFDNYFAEKNSIQIKYQLTAKILLPALPCGCLQKKLIS